jgi:CDP-4-dehydro-6-deoxyglucose reductase
VSFRVTLQPSGHSYEVRDGETVLKSGLEAGWNLPYSCRSGVCRTCRGKILDGRVDYGNVHPSYLPEEHRALGLALLCQAKPLSDVVVEVAEVSLHAMKPKIVPCRVKHIAKPAPDVAVMDVRLPMNENMMFAAGQYVDLLLKGGHRRSYSIATAPEAGGVIDLQFHIRHSPGGVFTDHVFSAMKERELLRFEGPMGTFYLREESHKPVVMVASGTGFAPIKAIIEYAIRLKTARPITFYWGCRTKRDLYLLDLPQSWAARVPGFRFVPVLSEPTTQDAWTGRTGFVHRVVMADFPDLSGHQVYACGAPVMVDAARRDFAAACGLPEQEFFADSFLTAADLARAAESAA